MAPVVTVTAAEGSPVGIFVYGTLRSDSGCTSRYCASFNEGCVSVPAHLPGARMFFDSAYPYIMLSEDGPGVTGRLVFPSNLDSKLREGDKIEQEGVMYHREVVSVVPEGETESVLAYVYVKREHATVSVPVECGDWVKADKAELLVAVLTCLEPKASEETVRTAVTRSNSDLRLARSMIKWGIV